MPRKHASACIIHTDVLGRLKSWGRCVRAQRVQQRIEHGDPGVSASSYLAALNALGLLDTLAPVPAAGIMSRDVSSRARRPTGFEDDF